jgi:hypothetical protein
VKYITFSTESKMQLPILQNASNIIKKIKGLFTALPKFMRIKEILKKRSNVLKNAMR